MKESYYTKKSQDWDKKAPSFSFRNNHSCYIKKFIQLLNPSKEWSVLDAGSGPGTVALPLSQYVNQVTAFDFSPKMLEILNERALKDKVGNIFTQLLSWEDDWQKAAIGAYDVAIASRSLGVRDLKSALIKLTNHAQRKVCITDRVGTGPHDPYAFRAIGRPLPQSPDYIYTVNLLYQLGHRAEVHFIHLEDTLNCKSIGEAVEAYSWMFKKMKPAEQELLDKYVRSITTKNNDGTYTVNKQHTPVWAFISWPT